MKDLNILEILHFSWGKTRQHAWFLVCSALIYGVIMSAVKATPILGLVVSLFVALSLLSLSLIIVRGESFSFADLFSRLRSPTLVLKFFVLTFVYTVVVGLLVFPFVASSSLAFASFFLTGDITVMNNRLLSLLLVTFLMFSFGVYVSVCFKIYPYVLLENEHMKMIDIVKRTYRLTSGSFWKLFFFLITLSILNLLGFILLGVGLLITVPISVFALAHLYRKLEGHSH